MNISIHLKMIHLIFHNLQCFSSQFSKLFMHTMQAVCYMYSQKLVSSCTIHQCFVDFSFLSFFQCITFYWAVSALCSLIQLLLLNNKKIQSALNIPDLEKLMKKRIHNSKQTKDSDNSNN